MEWFDAYQLVVGLEPEPLTPAQLWQQLSKRATTQISLALPQPGSPLGLAGPAEFNAKALEQAEALIISGAQQSWGLIPQLRARTTWWSWHPAHRPRLGSLQEADQWLRRRLLEVTDALVALEVAAWAPEIPDRLMNPEPLPLRWLPSDLSSAQIDSIQRALLCLDICELATASDGGARTSFEVQQRLELLRELDVAARSVLIASCSANLKGS